MDWSFVFFFNSILLGAGLAMDAFSVSICKGLGMKRVNFVQAAIIGIFFGGFQAIMPLIGFGLVMLFSSTTEFQDIIAKNASIIALIVLVFIGAKMIIDTIRGKSKDDVARAQKLNDTGKGDEKLNYVELLMLGLATSVDALMVGFAFAINDANMVLSVVVIGITTFLFSFVGVFIGHF